MSCSFHQRSEEGIISRGTRVRNGCQPPCGLLEIKARSSGRAANALTPRAISLALHLSSLLLFLFCFYGGY